METLNDNERVQCILNLAEKLLDAQNRNNIDEARVDSEFLFNFDNRWCKWVSRIRNMMRALIGLTGDEPLSTEDGARWLIHIESNAGLNAGMILGEGKTKFIITNSRGAYHILNKDLHERHNAILEHPFTSDGSEIESNQKFEEIWQQMWLEANQTVKIQSEIDRLIRAYSLVPADDELGDYPQNQVNRQYNNVINWILWGVNAPSFFYEKILLIENTIKDKGERFIRPCEWPNKQEFSKERLSIELRIRTWAIYFQCKRGGYKLEQQAAIDLWNNKFPNLKVELANFENDLTNLFAWGTGKELSPSLSASFTNIQKRWGVIIGVDNYNDKNIEQLHVCINDVDAISQKLLLGGFGQDSSIVITDTQATAPTRSNILLNLNRVANAAASDDLLFFYFSGHGFEENGESFLVPMDINSTLLSDTAVPISRIKELIQQSSAHSKLMVLDACHSGAMIKGKGYQTMSDVFINNVFAEAEGIAILSSCKQGELSYELPTHEHSVFTHFFLEGLSGEADKVAKGFITVNDIYLYVLDKVKQWALQNNCIQTPTFQAAVVGDIPIARY